MAFVARNGIATLKAIKGLYKAGFHKVIKDLFQCRFIQVCSRTNFDINTLIVKISLIT